MTLGAIINPWVFKPFIDSSLRRVEWPNHGEIQDEYEKYMSIHALYPSRNKYKSFHEINFKRMLEGCENMAKRDIKLARVPR